jgi:hypothetical protein
VLNTTYFDSIDTQEKAYWFGFILADGGLHKNGKQIRVLLASRDRQHLVTLANLFQVKVTDTAALDKRTGKTHHRSFVQLCSVHMWRSILEKSVPQRKCDIATAAVLTSVPDDQLRHFVRGYFDGDGCIGKIGRAEYRLTIVGPKCIVEALRELVSKHLGVHCGAPTFGTGIWRVTWCGTEKLNAIKRWLYDDATVYLNRKKQIFDALPSFRGSSRHKGVYYIQAKQHWVARVYRAQRMKTIGQYHSEAAAKQALDTYVVGFDSAVPSVMADFVRT